jgi:hypothetical protein
MRFSVDGWDPSYGSSLEADGEMAESSARIDTDVELPARRWQPIDPGRTGPLPAALLFVDGVRRIEAQVWVEDLPDADGVAAGDATAALCASYAAGVVCCCAAGAHLVAAERRRGLFSVAPHAQDILTRAGRYTAHSVRLKPGKPAMPALSNSLQLDLTAIEVRVAGLARDGNGPAPAPAAHRAGSDDDLLIVDGRLYGRQHLPRALGYIKSHQTRYLPPELNALVGRLAPGQRTPAFHMGTSWDRYSWYLRLPCQPGSPWAGIVRIECASVLPVGDVVELAGRSQRCLGRFASEAYKDTRAPQNLYPIAGLERELRRRLGDSRLLYRALREAARGDAPRPDAATASTVPASTVPASTGELSLGAPA